jgi:hypothetical protein
MKAFQTLENRLPSVNEQSLLILGLNDWVSLFLWRFRGRRPRVANCRYWKLNTKFAGSCSVDNVLGVFNMAKYVT